MLKKEKFIRAWTSEELKEKEIKLQKQKGQLKWLMPLCAILLIGSFFVRERLESLPNITYLLSISGVISVLLTLPFGLWIAIIIRLREIKWEKERREKITA